jgi:hypothetical protein
MELSKVVSTVEKAVKELELRSAELDKRALAIEDLNVSVLEKAKELKAQEEGIDKKLVRIKTDEELSALELALKNEKKNIAEQVNAVSAKEASVRAEAAKILAEADEIKKANEKQADALRKEKAKLEEDKRIYKEKILNKVA